MSEDGEARFRKPKTIYEELESVEKRKNYSLCYQI